jgi:lipopolysaccharide biosynthesis glycosyltransferase
LPETIGSCWQSTLSLAVAKKPLAFVMGISGDLAFAAGNIVLSLDKYMPREVYEIVIYYRDLGENDIAVLMRIPKVRLVEFQFDEKFVKTLLANLPDNSRFRNINQLMTFCHFEVFALLEEYEHAVWLDVDIAVQGNLKEIVQFSPFGITSDAPWTVQVNFIQPIPEYRMDETGYCAAVMIVSDTLPYRDIDAWCYQTTLERAKLIYNGDQGIINLSLQEFGIAPNVMPRSVWQCISWREEAITALIVHFGSDNKIWNTTNICNAFPEWYRTHLQWLGMGGSDFDRTRISPTNALLSLNEADALKDEVSALQQIINSLRDQRTVQQQQTHAGIMDSHGGRWRAAIRSFFLNK